MKRKENVLNGTNGANIGDLITFTRRERSYQALVINIRDRSVIAELLNSKDIIEHDLENERTVVAYTNYKIIKKSDIPAQSVYAIDGWNFGWRKVN
ncbi:DUF2187 family protein [Metabacillus herbersteinensis]|uniref:DUF2187 family protein n=1 Tax=Metabacillus herbersteinensis TaxID=283816 RepID=A0ABV6GIV9_9BACI